MERQPVVRFSQSLKWRRSASILELALKSHATERNEWFEIVVISDFERIDVGLPASAGRLEIDTGPAKARPGGARPRGRRQGVTSARCRWERDAR
jgi:hypothetical protein